MKLRNWYKQQQQQQQQQQKKKQQQKSKQWIVRNNLKRGMLANWDKKWLTQVGYFSRVNPGWKVSHPSETSLPGEMSHLI